jgi:hypothetical protein
MSRLLVGFMVLGVLLSPFPLPLYPALAAPGDTAQDTFRINQPAGQFGVRVNPQTQNAEFVVGALVKNVVAIFYTVAAIGVLIMMVWGATEWILSGGDKEKVAAARKRITSALIGLVILSLSYVILNVFSFISGFNIFQNLLIPGLGQGINPPASR